MEPMSLTNKMSKTSFQALDALNFFLADVRAGVGPFLATYLMATLHWNPAQIGVVMSLMGVASLLAETPCGALVDAVKEKRVLIVVAASLVGISCTSMAIFPNYYLISTAQMLNGVAAAIFPPAIAAITLGMVGQGRFSSRVGRNEVFNHAGNVVAAALAGAVGFLLGQQWIFYLVAILAVASIFSTLSIKKGDIDYLRARSATHIEASGKARVLSVRDLLGDRNILMFSLAVLLFHFGNAAMLPLGGQLITRSHESFAPINMSACIVAAQMVMIPVAYLAGRLGNKWGRKPIFLIGFAVLPIRGLLYTLTDNSFFVVVVQLLDGIGAGIFGVLSVIVVADLTQGTGRYNLVLGAIATAQGIGASLSNMVSGYIVHMWGFNAGFFFLASAATLALVIYGFLVPESQGLQTHGATSFTRDKEITRSIRPHRLFQPLHLRLNLRNDGTQWLTIGEPVRPLINQTDSDDSPSYRHHVHGSLRQRGNMPWPREDKNEP